MTTRSAVARRPAFIRYALAAALVAFAAWLGANTSCDDRLPGIILLPAFAVQFLIGLASFGSAGMAGWRGDRRRTLVEIRDGLVVLLSIPAAGAVFGGLLSRSCECCA